ncbi:MAG: hypothetical protein ACK5AK_02955 [Gemmatimonas sp.]
MSESRTAPDASSGHPHGPLVSPAQAWYAVAVLTLANVSGFMDRQILNLLVRPLRRDFGLSDTEVSLLMGLSFTIFYSVLGLPVIAVSRLQMAAPSATIRGRAPRSTQRPIGSPRTE